MQHPNEPQQPKEPHELAEPREARPSGAIRIVPDADVLGPDEQTLRLDLPLARPNAKVPAVPSILVDSSYLQAVCVVADRMRARRRRLTLAATCAFLCGALAWPLATDLVSRMAPPVTATHDVVKRVPVGASLQTPPMPMAKAPEAEPPHRTRMTQRDAARLVYGAEELWMAGRVRDARRLLIEVLSDRPGYPPAIVAMAEIELDDGQVLQAVRWARFAVRALPKSPENWELLGHACRAAGLHAESARALARARELHLSQQQ